MKRGAPPFPAALFLVQNSLISTEIILMATPYVLAIAANVSPFARRLSLGRRPA